MEPKLDLSHRYEFDWEVTDVIIGGQSALDSTKPLRIHTAEDAQRFIECYGYNLEDPIQTAELFGSFQEALSFIRRFFLQPENPEGVKLEIPRKIMELTDIRQLLIIASQPSTGNSQQALATLWACATIKVMHTIAHMDKDLRSNYYTDIQTQILDRFYKFIHNDEKNQIFLSQNIQDKERIPLVAFESKPKKARDSVLLKLLHKPENVAEDIFDRVGIRFVAKNRFDALRIIKFLRDRYVILPANIKPSRSRNTLINMEKFNLELSKMLKELNEGRLTAGDLDQKILDLCENNDGTENNSKNPHTSRHYRTIQFTCRQLVKSKNPLYDDLKALKATIKNKTIPDDIRKITDRLDLRNIQKEIRFFYPFEVQIYDEKSHAENLEGRSSHSNYKKSQIQTAMRRILGGLMRFANAQS